MNQTQNMQYEPVQSRLLQTESRAFPIDVAVKDNALFLGLSDYETMAPLWSKPKAHRSKINQVAQVDEKVFATASADASIRLWDVSAGKDIQVLRNLNQDDFYSVGCSQHILAAGSEGYIRFFDLRTMKLRTTFNESQGDEITGVKFNPAIDTELLSSSLDGLVVVYDLTKENEEESLTNMIRFQEPQNTCQYISPDISYSVSTTYTVSVINNKLGEKLKEVKTVQHDEFNQDYFIDVQLFKGQLTYFLGNKENPSVISQFTLDKEKTNNLISKSTEQIRHVKHLANHDSFLLFGEDGLFEVLQPKQAYVQGIETELQQFIEEEDQQIKGLKRFGKK